jgi:transposase
MRRFVEGVDRGQITLFPESLDDWVDENNPVRVIDAFVAALDLRALGFDGVVPEVTGRPSYHPAVLLKLYIYGYLNRVQSSRRLEREAGRNVELMWLTDRLMPDHKTIANFRKDTGRAIRQVCAQFVTLCRQLGMVNTASVAIDGSKFKAVNNRDRNFTRAKVERRRAQIEESVARYLQQVARYLQQLDTADRHEPTEALAPLRSRMAPASWFFACRSPSFSMLEPARRSLPHKVVGMAEGNRMVRAREQKHVVNGPGCA